MTNYRLTAWQREAHDRMECSELCPACARIDAVELAEPRGPRDHLTTFDYPER